MCSIKTSMDTDKLPVVLQRVAGYSDTALLPVVDAAMAHLQCTGSLRGERVLLKPNLISGNGVFCSWTNPNWVDAVCRWFLDHGAKIMVGDSPAFGSAAGVARRSGLLKTVDHLGVELIEFSTPVVRELPSGIRVTVAAEALDCDLFVGLPKIKAHQQLFTTMAVKNIFGIVKGTRKAMLHMRHGTSHRHFSNLILDLISLLPEQVHLADGIEVMHQSGPLHGECMHLGCVAAAYNPVALDTAMLAALELDFRRSPLWSAADLRRMKGTRLEQLRFPELLPESWHGSGFIAPEILNPIRFRPARFFTSMIKRALLAFAR